MSREDLQRDTQRVYQWKRSMESENEALESNLRVKEASLEAAESELQNHHCDLEKLRNEVNAKTDDVQSMKEEDERVREGLSLLASQMNPLSKGHGWQKGLLAILTQETSGKFKANLSQLEAGLESLSLGLERECLDWQRGAKELESAISEAELSTQKVKCENEASRSQNQKEISAKDQALCLNETCISSLEETLARESLEESQLREQEKKAQDSIGNVRLLKEQKMESFMQESAVLTTETGSLALSIKELHREKQGLEAKQSELSAQIESSSQFLNTALRERSRLSFLLEEGVLKNAKLETQIKSLVHEENELFTQKGDLLEERAKMEKILGALIAERDSLFNEEETECSHSDTKAEIERDISHKKEALLKKESDLLEFHQRNEKLERDLSDLREEIFNKDNTIGEAKDQYEVKMKEIEALEEQCKEMEKSLSQRRVAASEENTKGQQEIIVLQEKEGALNTRLEALGPLLADVQNKEASLQSRVVELEKLRLHQREDQGRDKAKVEEALSGLNAEIYALNSSCEDKDKELVALKSEKEGLQVEIKTKQSQAKVSRESMRSQFQSKRDEILSSRDNNISELKDALFQSKKDIREKRSELATLKKASNNRLSVMVKAKDSEINSYKENIKSLQSEIKKLEDDDLKKMVNAGENATPMPGRGIMKKVPKTYGKAFVDPPANKPFQPMKSLLDS